MQIQFGLAGLCVEWPEAVVCIGTFDGVHLGHREVIRRAVSLAEKLRAPCCLVTFDRHPAATLKPEKCPPALLSLESRLDHFADLGVALTVVLPFDREFSEISAEQFLDEILVARFKAKHVVVGYDFAMGRGRVGDAEWLSARIPTEIVPPFTLRGDRVSSSLVRKLVSDGDLEAAEELLGAAFEIEGVVIAGDRLGRQLGYPTANIARAYIQVSPPDGVYAGELALRGKRYAAAVSIGTRPTVKGVDRRIEAFCLDYHGNEFYGESCVLFLHRRLRGQETFDSLEELVGQIAKDVDDVRMVARSRSGLESIKA